MILSWTLENLPSELPMGGERLYTVNPGEVYPAGYIGSKYSLRKIKGKYSLSLKSYSGNHVEAKKLPKNLLSTLSTLTGNYSGTIRIRWNGDTLLAPQKKNDPTIYIGKMRYSEDSGKIFPGLDLDRKKDLSMSIYTGPQSSDDIGEKWSVSAPGWIRPKLTRRKKSNGKVHRTNTITGHPELINFIIHNTQGSGGKRFYVTNFGNIITYVDNNLLRGKGIDLSQEVEKMNNEGLFNASRFTFEKAKRQWDRTVKLYPKPETGAMVNIGNIEDFDSGIGPQPDLSTSREHSLNDDGNKEE